MSGDIIWDDDAHGVAWDDAAPAKPGVAEDIAKTAPSALAKGAIGVATAPIDMPKMSEMGVSYLLAKGAEKLGFLPKGKTAEDFVRSAQETFGSPNLASTKVQEAIESKTGKFYEPQTTPGKYVGTTLEMAPAVMTGGPGGLARKGMQAVGAGVGSEAAGQVLEGTGYETAGRVLGGMAGGMAPSAASRLVTPLPAAPTRLPMLATLDKEGVPLTAGQRTGSKGLRWAESVTADMPLSGGKAKAVEDVQKQAFTEAATSRSGFRGLATPENMAENYERMGKVFEDLGSRHTATLDRTFAKQLQSIASDYSTLVNKSQRSPGVEKFIIDLAEQAATSPQMPGASYNAIRSRLAELAREAGNQDSKAYGRIVGALDKAMERSIRATGKAEDIDAFKKVRREYANFKKLEKAAGSAGEKAAEGFISPASLRGAVSQGKDKARYVRGEGDLAELARAGVGVMSPLPQSGTGPRQYWEAAMAAPGAAVGSMLGGGGGAAVGAMAAPLLPGLAGRALMSRPVQAYLGNQVMTRAGALSDALGPVDNGGLLFKLLSSPELREKIQP
jgi:hypothetical protein